VTISAIAAAQATAFGTKAPPAAVAVLVMFVFCVVMAAGYLAD
jgi:hypothetical protein